MTWQSDVILVEEWPAAWWTESAACHGKTHLFFAPHGELADERMERERDAIAICETCEVLVECRGYALRIRVRDGVWGGLTSGARRRILRRKAS